jgi:ubiquinone/menaquinone biosynthesis C-methylase UbiE
MNDVGAAYDQAAERYRDHWGPVIAATGLRLLDRVASLLDAAPDATLVDVGTGTGLLAVAALDRWRALHAVGIDPSSGMLALARARADAAGATVADRLRLVVGEAQAIPLPDASCDLAVSSFVLQLVPDRSAALREIRRVLRPRAWLAAVTWLDEAADFEPLRIFDDLADEWDLPEDASGHETDPFASVASAAQELGAAGYGEVDAQPDAVAHQFTPESYLGLLENWERDDVFGPLEPDELRDVRAETLHRWAELPTDAFVWRAPVVSMVARKASR